MAVDAHSPEPQIRAAEAGDCAGLLKLWASSGVEAGVTDSVAALDRLLGTTEAALFVAEVDGKVVGSVIAGWDGWRGHLYRLVIHVDRRRRGVATHLVAAAEQHLRERGAVRIDAIVDHDDAVASGFWMAAGFRPHRRRSRFVRDLLGPTSASG
jgi:ribosomal protein S18 acetylase RimI-like enzyme